jgi:SAM-dependent methyltransferase
MAPRKTKDFQDGQRETLDDLSEAVHYNQWIHRLMEPYLGKRVLEVGCGIGNMTEFLALDRSVLAVDHHEGYLSAARKKFGSKKNVSFRRVDLGSGLSGLKKYRPDTIVCSNVLEHIRDDRGFLRSCLDLLPVEGKLLVFVPALPGLYGSMDRTYGHYRRYTKTGLVKAVSAAGFNVAYCRYMNLLGILGWWLNGKVLRRKVVPRGQILLYDRIVRFVMLVEKWLPKPIGLSLYCVAQRPARSRKTHE